MNDDETGGAQTTAVFGVVHGRVQGVSFRHSMRNAAVELGVAGWVRNQADGSVAFHAEGAAEPVAALLEWAGTGPSPARVDRVDVNTAECAGLSGFEILR